MSIGTALLAVASAAPLVAIEHWSIGLTTSATPIEALVVPAASWREVIRPSSLYVNELAPAEPVAVSRRPRSL